MTKEKGVVTAPTEPLKLTLEEAGALLAEHALVLLFDGDHDASVAWAVRPQWGPESWMREALGKSWPEVVSVALGRPVVARDDAADLEAELSKWRSAYVEVAGFLGMVSTDDTGRVGAVAGMEEVLAELEQREKDAAELRAALKELLTVVEGEEPHFGLMGMIDGYYGDFLDEVDPVVGRAHAALAATEGQS